MDRVRQRTKRKVPLQTKELIEELNPLFQRRFQLRVSLGIERCLKRTLQNLFQFFHRYVNPRNLVLLPLIH